MKKKVYFQNIVVGALSIFLFMLPLLSGCSNSSPPPKPSTTGTKPASNGTKPANNGTKPSNHGTTPSTGIPKSIRGKAPESLEGFAMDINRSDGRKKDHGPIFDGDTFRMVQGNKAYTLRLVGLDTEETFKQGVMTFNSMKEFKKYCAEKRKGSPRPVKFGTPSGEYAKEWARKWFRDVREIKLEYDEEHRKLGNYGRLLVYVFGKKGGKWRNYNLEAVQTGMSPYYYKYGFLTKYHKEFMEAHEKAKTNQLGIWNPSPPKDQYHYIDYPERELWWKERINRPAHFKKIKKKKKLSYNLGRVDDLRQLSYITAITLLEGKKLAGEVLKAKGVAELGDLASKLADQSPPLKKFAGPFVLDRMLDMAKTPEGGQDLEKLKKTFEGLYETLKAHQFQVTLFGLISEQTRAKIRKNGPNEISISAARFQIRKGENVSFALVTFRTDKQDPWDEIDMRKLSGYHWCFQGRLSLWWKDAKSKKKGPLWIMQIKFQKKDQIYFRY